MFITNVYGQFKDYITQIGFELNTGEVLEFGDDKNYKKFRTDIPADCAVGWITGEIGDYLYRIGVWYKQRNDVQDSPTSWFYLPMDDRFPYYKTVGTTHKDTTPFADDININQQNFRIDTVKVYFTNMCIGVLSIYEVDGQYVYGTKHLGSWVKENDKYDVGILNLEVDEFIIKILGHCDNQIEWIRFETNKNRVMEAGSKTKSSHEFNVDIPAGHCLGKIEGGKNGHLHNLKFYYGLIPQVYTNKL